MLYFSIKSAEEKMESVLSLFKSEKGTKSIIFDIIALSFIYFVPALSHMLSFPVYLIEPMRIMLILSLAHTNRNNAYIIALTLPLFSFFISSHPSGLKTALISFELLLNVWLFFTLTGLLKNKFAGMFLSIVLSKLAYYAVKYLLLSAALMSGDLVTTPIYIQAITTIIFSVYVYFFLKDSTLEGR